MYDYRIVAIDTITLHDSNDESNTTVKYEHKKGRHLLASTEKPNERTQTPPNNIKNKHAKRKERRRLMLYNKTTIYKTKTTYYLCYKI